MPTIDDIGPYKFYFIPLRARNCPTCMSVETVQRQSSGYLQSALHAPGDSDQELNLIQKLVEMNKERILHDWNEYFGR